MDPISRDQPPRRGSSDPWEKKLDDVKLSKPELNNLVMDYLITGGYPMAAAKFAREANIGGIVDIESITERVEIRDSIHKGDLQTAIEKINELNPELLDTNASLHFSLLRLQLIELIRTASTERSQASITAALEFATTHLAPCAPTDPKFLNDLERTMALLIFPQEAWDQQQQQQQQSQRTSQQSFGALSELVDPSLRRRVAEDVNQAILASQGERREAGLFELVRTRAWAEKQARDRKIDIPERMDVGLDGDVRTEQIGNGHSNGNARENERPEGDTVMAENGAAAEE